MILAPLARNAEEAVGSMGNDTPLAVLSDRKPLLYSYFKQLFAQVTNPPIDSIREAVVMSVQASVGSERNLLDETPEHARQLVIDNPILLDAELEQLRQVESAIFKARTLDITWPVAEGAEGMERRARARLRRGRRGARGRREHPRSSPTAPSAPSARRSRRCSRSRPCTTTSSARARACRRASSSSRASRAACTASPSLVGYGAAAVNPYLMLETLAELVDRGRLPAEMTREEAQRRAVKGDREGPAEDDVEDGHLDDAVVLRRADLRGRRARARAGRPPLHRHAVADRRHRASRRSPSETLARHARAYPGAPDDAPAGRRPLRLAPRRRAPPVEPGDDRAAPARRPARRLGDVRAVLAHGQRRRRARASTIRGLLAFRFAEDGGIPLDEVEPAAEIVKRFSTGAMSLGSLSREAHETLAVAMNRIGGRSNTGEGGEDPARYRPTRTATRGARRSSRSRPAASA